MCGIFEGLLGYFIFFFSEMGYLRIAEHFANSYHDVRFYRQFPYYPITIRCLEKKTAIAVHILSGRREGAEKERQKESDIVFGRHY